MRSRFDEITIHKILALQKTPCNNAVFCFIHFFPTLNKRNKKLGFELEHRANPNLPETFICKKNTLCSKYSSLRQKSLISEIQKLWFNFQNCNQFQKLVIFDGTFFVEFQTRMCSKKILSEKLCQIGRFQMTDYYLHNEFSYCLI